VVEICIPVSKITGKIAGKSNVAKMNIFKYRILNHILFWIFIYTFYTIPFILSYGLASEAFINLLYLPFDMAAVYFVIEFLIPRFLLKRKNIVLFLIGVIVTICANIAISFFLKYNVHPLLGFPVHKQSFVVEVFYSLLTNFMIVGLASAMKLLRYSYNMQLSKSELERRNTQSELNTLRSQVNPHFIFNVLNNIDSLIFEEREKASQAIFLLSKIMRYMLQESANEQVAIEKELAYIEDYLELATLSFGNQDFLDYSVEGEARQKKVPSMLFIPIIENTVKHCNKQAKPPGIQIKFKIGKNNVTLKTANFIKQADFSLTENHAGTGLKNVKKRLNLLFGENHTFEIKRNIDKFEVFLKIPVK
jgi:sensor histidine kinase YesM